MVRPLAQWFQLFSTAIRLKISRGPTRLRVWLDSVSVGTPINFRSTCGQKWLNFVRQHHGRRRWQVNFLLASVENLHATFAASSALSFSAPSTSTDVRPNLSRLLIELRPVQMMLRMRTDRGQTESSDRSCIARDKPHGWLNNFDIREHLYTNVQ